MPSARFIVKLNECEVATTRLSNRGNTLAMRLEPPILARRHAEHRGNRGNSPAMRLEPGALIDVDITCTFNKEVEIKHMPVTLKWRIWEEGEVRGETKVQAVDALTSGHSAAKTHTGKGTLQLPSEPWSYQGTLFQIQWVIQIDTGQLTSWIFGSDLRASVLIEVLPTAPTDARG